MSSCRYGCNKTSGQSSFTGSWVVISRLISRVTMLITHIRVLITPLTATHEPPSKLACNP